MIRLVAVDLDGTLLDSAHRVTTPVARAVARARSGGVRVVPCSSRPPAAMRPILAALGLLDADFVASQGALTGRYAVDGTLQVSDQRPMPVSLARQVARSAAAVGLSVNWFSGERWLVSEVDGSVSRESAITGCLPEVADLAMQPVGPDKLLLLAGPDHPGRGIEELPAGLAGAWSTPTHFEVTAAGVDKGRALAALCRAVEVAAAEVAAVGDGRNDLGMLRFAGLAIAVGNAHPDVLRVADLVVPSNDDDGVAVALGAIRARGDCARPGSRGRIAPDGH